MGIALVDVEERSTINFAKLKKKKIKEFVS